MKSFFLFILFLVIGFVVIAVYQRYVATSKPVPSHPKSSKAIQNSDFSIDNPPSDSLQGTLTLLHDNVAWQSRTATQSSQIATTQRIQQGEYIETNINGKARISFDDTYTIDIFENTKISIIQTLPATILIAQDSGKARYDKRGKIPLSVHALRLLIEQHDGTMTISVDATGNIVTIKVDSGSANAAFVDAENETQTYPLATRQTLIFDDDNRKATIQE